MREILWVGRYVMMKSFRIPSEVGNFCPPAELQVPPSTNSIGGLSGCL